MTRSQRIGITMGCPASIGPELIVKYYSSASASPGNSQTVVLGDIGILDKCCREMESPLLPVSWEPGTEIAKRSIPVIEVSQLDVLQHTWGRPTTDTGSAMARYITEGVRLTQAGILDGITTCPIAKTSLNEAGYHFPGHTEMLASLTKSPHYGMMMAGSKLKVTLVTIHCALEEVAGLLSCEKILSTIKMTWSCLHNDFGISSPKLGVAALNPHVGESGIFGDQEKTLIAPAIQQAREEGMDVHGPFPPDTVFYKCANGDFDGVVCMYHDQGLIPFKLLHFSDGVNVTMGLSIVRTSVDHGTAYDIAGKFTADHNSLTEAVKTASLIISNRKKQLT